MRHLLHLLHEPQSFFTIGGDSAKKFIASVRGGLNATAELGFPHPVSTSW